MNIILRLWFSRLLKETILNRLNHKIDTILKYEVKNITKPLPNSYVYNFDTIIPVNRFLLLNQTKISSKWNVTRELENNRTRLEWDSLPDEVKEILKDQYNRMSFMYQSFADWGWDYGEFSNSTLMDLMPYRITHIIPELKRSFERIQYDTVLDFTRMRSENIFQGLISSEVMNDYFISSIDYANRAYKFVSLTKNTAFDAFKTVWLRAKYIVKTFNILNLYF